MVMIFNPDSLRAQVEAATGGHITVLYDDKGYPSYMRVIPKFRYEDLGFDGALGTGVATAFIVNGQEKSEIFIGQHLASIHDGRALSLPGKDPAANINFDNAKLACTNKGPGWHMMTAHEWAALALWCKANNFEPRGNTNYGRAHDSTHETAIRQDKGVPGDTSGTARALTGSGPASWRHDGTNEGIADLVGNVAEWQDLLKIVDGRIHTPATNNIGAPEDDWTAQDLWLSNESGVLKLKNSAGNAVDASINKTWKDVEQVGTFTAPELMNRLLISPLAETELKGTLYANTSGERLPLRGGRWSDGTNAGLGYLNLNYARSSTTASIGFRPAFVA